MTKEQMQDQIDRLTEQVARLEEENGRLMDEHAETDSSNIRLNDRLIHHDDIVDWLADEVKTRGRLYDLVTDCLVERMR